MQCLFLIHNVELGECLPKIYMYSSKVGHVDINVAELLYWNRTVAHSQARTFRFLNKN